MGRDQIFRFHLYWFNKVVVKMYNGNRHANMVLGVDPGGFNQTQRTTDT